MSFHCQVGASYRSFADVPRGFHLDELTAFSWNSVESDLPDSADLDCADYSLVSRTEFRSRSASQGSALAPLLEDYFVTEGQSPSDAQESHPTGGGKGMDTGGASLPGGDTGDSVMAMCSGKVKSLRPRFLAAPGSVPGSCSLSFEKDSGSKDFQAGERGDASEKTGEKSSRESSPGRCCKTRGSGEASHRIEAAKMRLLTTAAVPTVVLIPGQPSLRFRQVGPRVRSLCRLPRQLQQKVSGNSWQNLRVIKVPTQHSRGRQLEKAARRLAVIIFSGLLY